MHTLPKARLSDVQPAPVFLVECCFGNLGSEFVSNSEHTRQNVIDNIASGDWSNVTSVREIHDDECSCRLITEDIAREVADALHASREPVSYELGTWLQQQIDVTVTHSLNFEHAQAAE